MIEPVGAPQLGEHFQRERARQAELLEADEHLFNGPILLALPWDGEGPLRCFEADYAWWRAVVAGAATSDEAGWLVGVAVLVQRTDGQWLWQVRSDAVEFPGHLHVAACGFVEPGETWQSTAIMELAEEIGVMPMHCLRLGEGDAIETIGTVISSDGQMTHLNVAMQAIIDADTPLNASADEVAELRLGAPFQHTDVPAVPALASLWSLIAPPAL